MKNYESLVDALEDLKKRGYEADFEPQSNCLYCRGLDLRLNEISVLTWQRSYKITLP